MKGQQGAILALCLVFLALLALMAAAGMESALLHERAATNMRWQRDGFEAAEAAVRQAETDIAGYCPSHDPDAGATAAALWPQQASFASQWWEEHGEEAQFAAGSIESARFFVETWLTAAPAQHTTVPLYYRVTARGAGASAAAFSIVQVVGVAHCAAAGPVARHRLSWRQLR